MNYTRKITTSSVGLVTEKVEALAAERKVPTPVLRAYGRVKGKIAGNTAYGPYIRFTGEFEAVNLITGDKFRSTNLILPEVATAAINEAYDKATAVDKEAAVQFGLDLTAAFNDNTKGGVKFRWGVKSLIEAKGDDSLSLLGKELGEAPLLLTNEAKPIPETEPKKAASGKK